MYHPASAPKPLPRRLDHGGPQHSKCKPSAFTIVGRALQAIGAHHLLIALVLRSSKGPGVPGAGTARSAECLETLLTMPRVTFSGRVQS